MNILSSLIVGTIVVAILIIFLGVIPYQIDKRWPQLFPIIGRVSKIVFYLGSLIIGVAAIIYVIGDTTLAVINNQTRDGINFYLFTGSLFYLFIVTILLAIDEDL
jgi:hypothetical protein